MHVKIQGGGDGVYANSGSCVAAAMYCEHERQELMKKGMNPETFFHQYSDFVSTREVIERIDNNKKKLRKEDAKFFVMTVSPSVDEQRKMGSSIDERIAAFKNYIRNGVMAEYAKNFERGLTANDIMYYAYVHVERGEKTGEQMHAHIVVSRRNIDNSISLSPQSNHRSGKGVIAHGFDRDSFYAKCEHVFDNMLNYSRPVEESYEYRNAMKNGTFQDIANVTARAAELEYGVNLTDWDKLVSGELDNVSVSETEVPKYEPTASIVPETEPSITETKAPVHQSMDDGIIGFAKKAWKSVTSLFARDNSDKKSVLPIQDTKQNATVIEVSVYKNNEEQWVLVMESGGVERSANIDAEDASKYEQAKNSGNAEEINKVCRNLENKYLKDAPDLKMKDKEKQEKVKEQPPIQKIKTNEKKQVLDGLRVFKAKGNEYYSAAIYKDGKQCRYANKIDIKDASEYFAAKNSGNKDYIEKVAANITAKYFHENLAQKIADEFVKKVKDENVTSVNIIKNSLSSSNYIGIRYKVDGEWSGVHRVSYNYAQEVNELPIKEIEFLFNILESMISIDNINVGASCGASNNNKRRKDGDEDEEDKKKQNKRTKRGR